MGLSLTQLELDFLRIYNDILNNEQEIAKAIATSEAFDRGRIALKDTADFFDANGNVKESYKGKIDNTRYQNKSAETYYQASISDRNAIILYAIKMAAGLRLQQQYFEVLAAQTDDEVMRSINKLGMVDKVLDTIKDANMANPCKALIPTESFQKQLKGLIQQKEVLIKRQETRAEIDSFISCIERAQQAIASYTLSTRRLPAKHPILHLGNNLATIQARLEQGRNEEDSTTLYVQQKQECRQAIDEAARKILFITGKRLINRLAAILQLPPPCKDVKGLDDIHDAIENSLERSKGFIRS